MKRFVLASALLCVVSACIIVVDGESGVHTSWFSEQGSGVAANQTRDVAPFTRIRIEGSTDVSASPGSAQVVTVIADDNLIDRITTRVEDGVLVIGMKSGSYSFHHGPRVIVAYTALSGLSISGSGDARIDGLDAEAFRVDVAGSGSATLRGKAQRLDVTIAGSGDVEAFDLTAQRVSVSISGSGDARVFAAADLDASIAGSGSIGYRGKPSVHKSIAGSGTIHASAAAD